MTRRVGRYTKDETTELIRMFNDGYSVYKICRNLNRSQKSIKNLNKADGLVVGSAICKEITRSLSSRQNPVTNIVRLVKKLKRLNLWIG